MGATKESMSARAAAYQHQVTGAASGQVYRVGGVKFDGYDEVEGVLLDAKGPGFETFLGPDGAFHHWFNGEEEILGQAGRQLRVAGGTPIRWHVAEERAAHMLENLFFDNDISIEVVFSPVVG